jgi:hypothetical protein
MNFFPRLSAHGAELVVMLAGAFGIDVTYQHEAPASEFAQILTRWRFVKV